jgi:hypothetical protein
MAVKIRVELDRTYVLSVGVSLAAPYVAETTRQVLNRARVLCPKDTGNLANSMRMTMRARRTYVAGTVETRVKYATYVHQGTAPHRIYPKGKGALAFDWPKVGMRVVVPKAGRHRAGGKFAGPTYSKKSGPYFLITKGYVNHPGTKARPWLMDALRQVGKAREFEVSVTGLGSPELP